MGRHVKRQTPRRMPTAEQVQAVTAGMPKPFLVAGAHGMTAAENRLPDFSVHGKPRFVTGSLADFADKHVVVFLHGYNVTADEAMTSAKEFFTLLFNTLRRDQLNVDSYVFVLFTWPGDTGTVFFDDAQLYAQHSGVALYEMLQKSRSQPPKWLSLVTHSLGAHVALRALVVLGERRFHGHVDFRVDRTLLLGAAVEDDVFHRPDRSEEYHFPEAAFGVRQLHIVTSRDDDVLGTAFRVNEFDKALGHSGPESMEPLRSLLRRVSEVLGPHETFAFEQHDFSHSSPTIMDPRLQVDSHGAYWKDQKQVNYYVNVLKDR
jgi:pimeloyl-ACP methyl ester carboxylesterase